MAESLAGKVGEWHGGSHQICIAATIVGIDIERLPLNVNVVIV
jgi:hypothetical protein